MLVWAVLIFGPCSCKSMDIRLSVKDEEMGNAYQSRCRITVLKGKLLLGVVMVVLSNR